MGVGKAPLPLPTRPEGTAQGSFLGRASAPGGGPTPLAPGETATKRSPHPAPLPSNSREGPRQPISPQGSRGPLPPEHPVKEAAQRERRTPHAATAEAATADRSTGTTHNAVLHPPSLQRGRGCARQQVSPQRSRGPLSPEHPAKEAAQRERRTPHTATAGAAAMDQMACSKNESQWTPRAITALLQETKRKQKL